MADDDRLFARIIAGIPVSSSFDHNNSETTSVASWSMAQPFVSDITSSTQYHNVSKTDPDYIQIKSDLETAGLTLIRLVKLTNAELADKFQSESTHLLKMKPKDFSLNVHYLYHGTTAPFKQICEEGLDERLSRRGRFGRGIYFSDSPMKCCKYSIRQNTTERYLLRCQVIMGDVKEYADGAEDRELAREPIKTVKDGKRVYYDSVKGRPRGHNEYVIYEKRRALIEYVAFYESNSKKSHLQTTDVSTGSSSTPAVGYGDGQLHSTSGNDLSTSDDETSEGSDVGTPDISDDEAATDVKTVQYEQIPRVSVVRNRSRIPQNSNDNSLVSTANVVAASSDTTSSAAAAASASVDVIAEARRKLSPEVLNTPHIAALKYLIEMKGKLSAAEMEKLTREYHRTYGTRSTLDALSGSISTTSLLPDKDPVAEVMSQLVKEFKDVTQCSDDATCRKYIEMGQFDLNRAVEAYIDSLS